MSHSSIHIGKIGLEFFEQAFFLLERFFREEGFSASNDMRSSLANMIEGPHSAVFLARENDRAIGVATVATTMGLEYGRAAEIDDLYVIAEARGKGIASTLIETVCKWSVSEGCSTVLVTVTPEGDTAYNLIAFYQHHGFVNSGRTIMDRRLST